MYRMCTPAWLFLFCNNVLYDDSDNARHLVPGICNVGDSARISGILDYNAIRNRWWIACARIAHADMHI